MKKTIFIQPILISLFVIGLVGYLFANSWSSSRVSYKIISTDEFIKRMNNKDFTLINVHIPYEGEIPKTDLLIPFNNLENHINELPDDKDSGIVVYCMSGPMGDVAAEKLVSMGYSRVFHFKGGMRAWKKSGNKLQYRPI